MAVVTGRAGRRARRATAERRDCSICEKANACCNAVEVDPATNTCAVISAATCNGAGAQKADIIAACQTVLEKAAAANIAACK